ncbi:MAG: hypothetical protein AVDCRST_MAG49-3212 [uncultured Thermomicrobiales bacterium]|uniref:Uncharacterized protein n=1 Tax=uncultured Thermomicrobiales bacterium TaxID=1645740 RepID=A0A6J4V5I3_9BACT|nr:MAG: hypothetical protein AVDCRST_MAG49-3212 [uncultured Thermomicrobiales bacterium]
MGRDVAERHPSVGPERERVSAPLGRLRAYGTALLLTMGLFSAVPPVPDVSGTRGTAIVRVADRRRGPGRFDPGERLEDGLVLTIPLADVDRRDGSGGQRGSGYLPN